MIEQTAKDVAYVHSQCACAIIEAMGMVAANKERKQRGHSLAYGEEAFQKVIEKYGIHHNAVLSTLRNY
jgi:hypothetical protein